MRFTVGKQEPMTDAEISALVERVSSETAERVVKQIFLTLGIDSANPMEMQADMQHLRSWRNSVATVKRQGFIAATGVIVVGVLGLIWTAISNNHPTP